MAHGLPTPQGLVTAAGDPATVIAEPEANVQIVRDPELLRLAEAILTELRRIRTVLSLAAGIEVSADDVHD